jgi:hypothetical protein
MAEVLGDGGPGGVPSDLALHSSGLVTQRGGIAQGLVDRLRQRAGIVRRDPSHARAEPIGDRAEAIDVVEQCAGALRPRLEQDDAERLGA